VPFDVVLTYADGTIERVHRTPAVWRDTPREAVVRGTSDKRLASAAIDTGIFVDFVPADNRWQAPQ
jgi:hypothetical protein